jgi:hypothetical protein
MVHALPLTVMIAAALSWRTAAAQEPKRPPPWHTLVSMGPQVSQGRVGGEVSVLRVTFDGRLTGGWAGTAGADRQSGYAEAEGVLILNAHDAKAELASELPILFFTGGIGPAMRWTTGAPGVQATASACFVGFPLIFFARVARFAGEPATGYAGGVMFKLPVWGTD